MIETTIEVRIPEGLHARPAAELVKLASQFQSEIFLSKQALTANAKSIMSLLSLAAEPGAKLHLRAHGPDEQEAARAIQMFFEHPQSINPVHLPEQKREA